MGQLTELAKEVNQELNNLPHREPVLQSHLEEFFGGALCIDGMIETGDLSKLREIIQRLKCIGQNIRFAIDPNTPLPLARAISNLKKGVVASCNALLPGCETPDEPTSKSIDHLVNIEWGADQTIRNCTGEEPAT